MADNSCVEKELLALTADIKSLSLIIGDDAGAVFNFIEPLLNYKRKLEEQKKVAGIQANRKLESISKMNE